MWLTHSTNIIVTGFCVCVCVCLEFVQTKNKVMRLVCHHFPVVTKLYKFYTFFFIYLYFQDVISYQCGK